MFSVEEGDFLFFGDESSDVQGFPRLCPAAIRRVVAVRPAEPFQRESLACVIFDDGSQISCNRLAELGDQGLVLKGADRETLLFNMVVPDLVRRIEVLEQALKILTGSESIPVGVE